MHEIHNCIANLVLVVVVGDQKDRGANQEEHRGLQASDSGLEIGNKDVGQVPAAVRLARHSSSSLLRTRLLADTVDLALEPAIEVP